jgi:hypothetical protein
MHTSHAHARTHPTNAPRRRGVRRRKSGGSFRFVRYTRGGGAEEGGGGGRETHGRGTITAKAHKTGPTPARPIWELFHTYGVLWYIGSFPRPLRAGICKTPRKSPKSSKTKLKKLKNTTQHARGPRRDETPPLLGGGERGSRGPGGGDLRNAPGGAFRSGAACGCC